MKIEKYCAAVIFGIFSGTCMDYVLQVQPQWAWIPVVGAVIALCGVNFYAESQKLESDRLKEEMKQKEREDNLALYYRDRDSLEEYLTTLIENIKVLQDELQRVAEQNANQLRERNEKTLEYIRNLHEKDYAVINTNFDKMQEKMDLLRTEVQEIYTQKSNRMIIFENSLKEQIGKISLGVDSFEDNLNQLLESNKNEICSLLEQGNVMRNEENGILQSMETEISNISNDNQNHVEEINRNIKKVAEKSDNVLEKEENIIKQYDNLQMKFLAEMRETSQQEENILKLLYDHYKMLNLLVNSR